MKFKLSQTIKYEILAELRTHMNITWKNYLKLYDSKYNVILPVFNTIYIRLHDLNDKMIRILLGKNQKIICAPKHK